MANLNAPSGLSFYQYGRANDMNAACHVYYIPSTDTNAYAIGDPVKSLTGAASANGIPSVTLASAGASNLLRGVVMSAGGALGSNAPINVFGAGMYDPNALGTVVIPASKTQGYFVTVADDPDMYWEVQSFSGSGSTPFTAADIGKNANLKVGTNNGYISGWTIDDTAVSSTSSTYQLKLLWLKQSKDNAIGSYARYIVQINQHELNSPSAGV